MKFILIIISIIIILIGVFFSLKNRVGDVRPALLPPAQNIADVIDAEQTIKNEGDPPTFPINLPEGFTISIFAQEIGGARDLVVSENNTLIVSSPSQDSVFALPDQNRDGKTDEVKLLLSRLDKPHGLAFFDKYLFVAEENQVARYTFDETSLSVNQDKILFSIPEGGRHTTRTIAFNKQGQMFVSIGSTCDTCRETHPWFAATIVSDKEGSSPRLFAKGLRNSVFITINPTSDTLWATEMGRDCLGDDLPPDEVNLIKDGGDYGWPFCYGNKVVDKKFDNSTFPQRCEPTEKPLFEICAHCAPLGLAFVQGTQFPDAWQGDLLISYHGSWNSSEPVGYKIVRLNIEGDTITSEEEFISGFLKNTEALGRPVDLVFDQEGSLFISDDKAGVVYKVTYNK